MIIITTLATTTNDNNNNNNNNNNCNNNNNNGGDDNNYNNVDCLLFFRACSLQKTTDRCATGILEENSCTISYRAVM